MTDALHRNASTGPLDRCRLLLPGVWAGWLLCTALAATPSAFALLQASDAGRVVARLLALEAYTSLAAGALLLLLERAARRRVAGRSGLTQFGAGMGLALFTVFCTIAGYFGVLPLMAEARAGHGMLSFGQLHGVSATFFLCKVGVVLVLAWRAAATSGAMSVAPARYLPQPQTRPVSQPPSS